MSVENMKNYSPTDPELIDKIVNSIKAKGIFDQFRRDCLADVDTKPAYQNLQQRVNGTVSGFLASQKWQQSLNKTQLRESLRRHTVQQAFLEVGVDRIVDQVVNPKIFSIFMPKVEDVVCECLGIERPKLRRELEKLPSIKKPSPLPSPFQEREKTPPPVHVEEKIEEETKDEQQDLPKAADVEPSPVLTQPTAKENPGLPEDLEPVSPASKPDVVNNNDDDSNTFDELPLLAALIGADSNQVESSVLDSAPQTCITKSSGPFEISDSQSVLSVRPQLEYDTSTNNLSSLKSDDKLSPTKKFDNFSNLGEKLKQADVNLRETSANKSEQIMAVVDLTELSESPINELQATDSKIEVPDDSNLSFADNSKTDPSKIEIPNNNLTYSDNSFSSLPERNINKSDELKNELSPVSKHSNHKKLGNSQPNETMPIKTDEEKELQEKICENKKKDKGKISKHSSQSKSMHGKSKSSKDDKNKSQRDHSSSHPEKSAKQESEKDRKDKKSKPDKNKTEDMKVNDSKHTSKKRREESSSHHSKLTKDPKSDKKVYVAPIEKEKHKEDKEKKSNHTKVKNESSSSLSTSKSEKNKSDKLEDKNDVGEDKSKSSRKRKSGRCKEDEATSKNPRRSSDRDGSGSSGKPKPNNSPRGEARKSKSDKGRSQHKSKNSSKSNAENDATLSLTEADEVDKILMEINNSIEDENLRVDISELLSESGKKPKIASSFHEMKKVMKFRKHKTDKDDPDSVEITKVIENIVPEESNIPVDDEKLPTGYENDSIAVSNLPTVVNAANERFSSSNVETADVSNQMGLKRLSVVVKDVLKGASIIGLAPNSKRTTSSESNVGIYTSTSTFCYKSAANDNFESSKHDSSSKQAFQLLDNLEKSSSDSNEKSNELDSLYTEGGTTGEEGTHVKGVVDSQHVTSKTKLKCTSNLRNMKSTSDERCKHESKTTTTDLKESSLELCGMKNTPQTLKNVVDSYDDRSSIKMNMQSNETATIPEKNLPGEQNEVKSTSSLLASRSRRKNAGSLMYAILEEYNEKFNCPKTKEGMSGSVHSTRANKRKSKLEQRSFAEPSKSEEGVNKSCTLDDSSDISNKENETNVSGKGKVKSDVSSSNVSKQIETRLIRKKCQMREVDNCKSDNMSSKERTCVMRSSAEDSNSIDAKRSIAQLNLRNAGPAFTMGLLSGSSTIDSKQLNEIKDESQLIEESISKKMNVTYYSMENIGIESYLKAFPRRKSCPAIFHSTQNDEATLLLQANDLKSAKINCRFAQSCTSTPSPEISDEVESLNTRRSTIRHKVDLNTSVESLCHTEPATAITCVSKFSSNYLESSEEESEATLPPKELVNGNIDQFREKIDSCGSDWQSLNDRSALRSFQSVKSIRKNKTSPTQEPIDRFHTPNDIIEKASVDEDTTAILSTFDVYNTSDADHIGTLPKPVKSSSFCTSSLLDDSTESEFKGFSADEGSLDPEEDFGGFTEDDIQKAFDQLRILKYSTPIKTSLTASSEISSSKCRTVRAYRKIASDESTNYLNAIVKDGAQQIGNHTFSCNMTIEKEESSFSKCKATSKDSGLCDSPEMEKGEELYSEVESTDYGVAIQRNSRSSSNRKLQMTRHADLLPVAELPPAKKRILNTRKSRVSQSYNVNELYKPRPSLRSQR